MLKKVKAPNVKPLVAVYEQKKWIEEHGGSEEAYVMMYGSADDRHHYGDGGEAIYKADIEHLHELERIARIEVGSTPIHERLYLSLNTERPWHILARRTDFISPDTDGRILLSACRERLHSSFPGWPKQITMEQMRRLFPSAVVCRQCSDNAPL